MLMEVDPKKRIKAAEAVKHPWIEKSIIGGSFNIRASIKQDEIKDGKLVIGE